MAIRFAKIAKFQRRNPPNYRVRRYYCPQGASSPPPSSLIAAPLLRALPRAASASARCVCVCVRVRVRVRARVCVSVCSIVWVVEGSRSSTAPNRGLIENKSTHFVLNSGFPVFKPPLLFLANPARFPESSSTWLAALIANSSSSSKSGS